MAIQRGRPLLHGTGFFAGTHETLATTRRSAALHREVPGIIAPCRSTSDTARTTMPAPAPWYSIFETQKPFFSLDFPRCSSDTGKIINKCLKRHNKETSLNAPHSLDIAEALLYLFGAIAVFSIGLSLHEPWLIVLAASCAGFGIVGGQAGTHAVASRVYPAFMRSTGMGWALGIGRVGSVIGPLIGGVLLARDWPAPGQSATAGGDGVVAYGSIDGGLSTFNDERGAHSNKVDTGNRSPDRFGFRGTEDLGGGMRGFFQLENGFNLDDGSMKRSGVLFSRRGGGRVEQGRYADVPPHGRFHVRIPALHPQRLPRFHLLFPFWQPGQPG
jgi:hypothetical protein